MTSVFKVEITESIEELKTLVSKQTNVRLRDRVRALYLCKTGLAQTRRELAAMLGCHESTIYRWLCSYQNQGLAGLMEVKASPGKPSKLASEVLNKLRARLAERVGFRSYGEIQSWLERECGVSAAYQTVHGIVRYQLNSKLKQPRPVSADADPQVQSTFKKNSLI